MEKLEFQATGLKAGSLVGNRYRIERAIGEGGMGEVYLAVDELLSSDEGDNQVALKVLRPDFCKEEKYRKRFLREVQLTRVITHPNVIRTFEVGTHENLLFFTMEYVRGEPLNMRMGGEPLAFESAVLILMQALKGLIAIHASSIVHRDLKPGNLLITKNGEIKIGDFGIARGAVSDLTTNQEVLGSAFYMSPEMWLGDDVTSRSDVYSLGVLAYELVTGVVPFDGAAAPEVMCKHLELAPVPPLSLAAGVPAWFSDLIVSMLAKSPKRRPGADAVLRVIEINMDPGLARSSADRLALDQLGNADSFDEGEEELELEETVLPKREYIDQRRVLEMEHTKKEQVGILTKIGYRFIGFCICSAVALCLGAALWFGIAVLANGTWLNSLEDPAWLFGVKLLGIVAMFSFFIPILVLPTFALFRSVREAIWFYGAVAFRVLFLMVFTVSLLATLRHWGPWKDSRGISERAKVTQGMESAMRHSLAAVMFLPELQPADLRNSQQAAKAKSVPSAKLEYPFHFVFTSLFLLLLTGFVMREEVVEGTVGDFVRFFIAIALVPMAGGWALFAKVYPLSADAPSVALDLGPIGFSLPWVLIAWSAGVFFWISLMARVLSQRVRSATPTAKHS